MPDGKHAQVAKLVDAIGLGPIARKGLGVRVSPCALFAIKLTALVHQYNNINT